LENFLSEEDFAYVKKLALDYKENMFRKDSLLRSGSALSLHELQESSCVEVVNLLVNPDFLARVRDRTGMLALDYIGAEDTFQISLLYYGQPGDGIDWHFDGNIYLGKRWAGIFTLHEATGQAHSKLEVEQNGLVKTFPVGVVENTLLVFQGDQVKHRVRPMYEGEERLVVNMVFSDNPTQSQNPFLKGYQSLVNYFFYGKLKT